MRTTQESGSPNPKSNSLPSRCSPEDAERAFSLLEGRWKLSLLYHLFDRGTMRFSDFERAIPKISQRMLTQQLRSLERDGIVSRTAYLETPPKVEYRLTTYGAGARPILHDYIAWANGNRHA